LKIRIIAIGKTSQDYLRTGQDVYLKRLAHYTSVEYKEFPDPGQKGSTPELLKLKEGELILKQIKPDDVLILLDEKGQEYSSREFAGMLQKRMNAGTKSIVLVIGGAFGFSKTVYDRADLQLSFSRMTFSHEMIRIFLLEQLYRAFTILKGENYHHD
jgi:23S rRNA (pseudouridine1915-N3)-methyltransferase